MKKELQEELFALAPEWFDRDHVGRSAMYWGFECGDGWFELLKQLITDLKPMAGAGFRVTQVKEKFGGLRFYVYGSNEAVEQRINQAENASYHTCEDCGADGATTSGWGGGWVSTLCDVHGRENELRIAKENKFYEEEE